MRKMIDILRGLREDHDYKQAEIASILKIPQQSYSRYENGENELPVRHLITLAEFYHVSLDYLVGLSEFKYRSDSLETAMGNGAKVGELLSTVVDLDAHDQQSLWDFACYLRDRQKEKK